VKYLPNTANNPVFKVLSLSNIRNHNIYSSEIVYLLGITTFIELTCDTIISLQNLVCKPRIEYHLDSFGFNSLDC